MDYWISLKCILLDTWKTYTEWTKRVCLTVLLIKTSSLSKITKIYLIHTVKDGKSWSIFSQHIYVTASIVQKLKYQYSKQIQKKRKWMIGNYINIIDHGTNFINVTICMIINIYQRLMFIWNKVIYTNNMNKNF